MPKITIHGFYGEGNLGDEAILTALLRELRRFPALKPVVLSKNPERVAAEHGVRSAGEQGGSSRPRRSWEILTSRLVVLGGGGLLRDYGEDSANVERWLRIIRVARRLRRKTALWLVGVDDIRYPESERLIRETLAHVDFISVRDADSAEVLRALGVAKDVTVASDPALLLVGPEAAVPENGASPPRVAVCVRHWFEKGFYIEKPEVNERLLDTLGQALDFLVEEYDAMIDFLPFRTTPYDDDRAVARAVQSKMIHRSRTSLEEAVPETNRLIRLLGRYSLVIGMRLHSLILSAGSGIPVIGLEYMPKIGSFMRSIGQEDFSLPLETISRENLVDRIGSALSRRDDLCRSIRTRVSVLRGKARDSVEILAELAGVRTGRVA